MQGEAGKMNLWQRFQQADRLRSRGGLPGGREAGGDGGIGGEAP